MPAGRDNIRLQPAGSASESLGKDRTILDHCSRDSVDGKADRSRGGPSGRQSIHRVRGAGQAPQHRGTQDPLTLDSLMVNVGAHRQASI